MCGPKGRDCIEDNIVNTFNCITTCRGIYADVQWVGNNINEEMKDELPQHLVKTQLEEGRDDDLQKRVAFLERLLEKEIKLVRRDFGKIVKSTLGKGVDERYKEKYKRLISVYRKFKIENVKHFRFNSVANLSTFGEDEFVQSKHLKGQL